MAKLGQKKTGAVISGNITAETGYGIVYADEIIGHRRVNTYSDLANIPAWALYNKAGGDDPSTAIGQLWYVTKSDEAGTPETMHTAGLYQLTAFDGTTRTWKLFKNGADIVDTNTTYSLSGSDATITLKGTDGKTYPVTVNNVVHADGSDRANKANSDGNGNNIVDTYLTKTDASTIYATKDQVSSLTSALVYKGTVDETHALPTEGVKVGDVYVVAAAGTYALQACENGDMIIASSTTPTWTIVQANINGAVTSRGEFAENAIILGDGHRSIKAFGTTSTAGYLYWGGEAYEWKTPAEFSLSAANADDLGGIKVGYTSTDRNYAVQLDKNNNAYVKVPWTDTKIVPATTFIVGGAKIASDTTQIVPANDVSDAPSRTYGIQMNSDKQLVVNVPWTDTDTKYTLPAATSSAMGGAKLASDDVQTEAANAITNTASRTYGVQKNDAGQLVVNVPWENTVTIVERIPDDTITNTFK